MKSPLSRIFTSFFAFSLLFISACDPDTPGTSIISNSQQSYNFRLGAKSLVLVNNIYNDNNHIRIDGHDTVTVVKVRITKVGTGATQTIADNLRNSISNSRSSTAFEEVLVLDSPAQQGAHTITTVTMPRTASLRVVDKQGKHEIYNVDGRVDLNVWKGWVTLLSASTNVKSHMDFGDMILNLQHCKEDGILDAKMEGEGSVTITVPRLLNSPQPTTATLRAENKDGGVDTGGLTLLGRSDVKVGANGMLITGAIDRGNGSYQVLVNKGSLLMRAWAGVTKK